MAKIDVSQLTKLIEDANNVADFQKSVKADAERAKARLEQALVAVDDLIATLNSAAPAKKEPKASTPGTGKKRGRPAKNAQVEAAVAQPEAVTE